MPRVRHTRLIAVVAALALAFDGGVGARALSDAPARVAEAWSTPVVAGSGALSDPRAVFSSAGAGAIAWGVAGGARALTLAPAAVGATTRSAVHELSLQSVAGATSDGSGRVVLAGELGANGGRATAALEADPSGPFGAARALNPGGGPVALTDYLTGEVALAAGSPAGGVGRVLLRLQQRQAQRFGAPVQLSAMTGLVSAIAVGLDYRGDALVAWQQSGRIWARVRHLTGTLGPLQTLGSSRAAPRLGALVSDDQRGIVAWTDETAAGAVTRAQTFLSISGLGVHFAAATPVETWAEPAGFHLGTGAMRLLRLADGRVMLGWTGWQDGEPVVRMSAVALSGLRPPVVVSQDGTAAQLTDLVPGARGEALAVLSASEPGASLDAGAEIETAVGVDEGVAGTAVFAPVEPVAAAPADNQATAAFDPLNDRPIVTWRAGAQIRYATRAAEALP